MARPITWSPKRAREYRRLGYWTTDTYGALCDLNAENFPTGVALSDEQRSVTWAEARDWSNAVASSLVKLRFPRDGVLATWLPNCIENYLLRFACEKAGILWLPLSWASRQHELQPILERAQANGIALASTGSRDSWAELKEMLPELPHITHLFCLRRCEAPPGVMALEDLAAQPASAYDQAILRRRQFRAHVPAMLQPTSGSTGIPKLSEYPLCAMVARGRAQAELFHLGPEDSILAAVQGYGPSITPILAAPLAASQVVVARKPTAEMLLRLIELRHVSVVCAVPPILRDIAEALSTQHPDVSSVRIWYSTGMSLPPEVARELEERTRGISISGYGAVDFGGWAVPSPEDPPEVRWRTVGKPRGGSQFRLVSETSGRASSAIGEIWGRGPCFVSGYYRDPVATRQVWGKGGWFKTGDLGRFDDQENLVIVGRKTEVLNRGGRKIFPSEVEALLESHPRIQRAALVPTPDPRLGERACAFVVVADNQNISLAEVVAFLRSQRLASYKLPERLEVVESLPTTGGGKVDRQALRSDLLAKLSCEGATVADIQR